MGQRLLMYLATSPPIADVMVQRRKSERWAKSCHTSALPLSRKLPEPARLRCQRPCRRSQKGAQLPLHSSGI